MSVTIAQWSIPVSGRYTIKQYHALIATGVLADKKVELIAGNIVEMTPEGMPHAVYCGRTVEYLRELLTNRAKVREAHPITLPDDSEPEPDVAIVRPPDTQYLAHHPYPEDIFWLIEYADSTLAKDINDKQLVYARAGIMEYWVVNLTGDELIVFRGVGDNGYQTEVRLNSGSIASLAFPEIDIEVKKLFSF
jgi:Uma2 family endonuclease